MPLTLWAARCVLDPCPTSNRAAGITKARVRQGGATDRQGAAPVRNLTADRFHTCIQWGHLHLDVRRSVAWRELGLKDGAAFYLSLLGDEIDDRFERYLEPPRATMRVGLLTCEAIQASAPKLELTDALVVCARDGSIAVLRGGSCTFPMFWRRSESGLRLSTALPLHEDAKFSAAGLVSAAAAVCLHSSYEPNAWVETPLCEWRRTRRGALTRFGADLRVDEQLIIDRSERYRTAGDEDAIARQVREAFDAYGVSQRYVTASVVELSGGFDSTLAAAAALNPRHRMGGVSVQFPYYEFRFEEAVQAAVGEALNIPRTVFDGTQMFPYAPSQRLARFEEPAVFVTGIRHAERVADFSAAAGATHVYTGHGGDQLFCTDLTAREQMVTTLPTCAPFSRAAWRAMKAAIAQTRSGQWRERAAGTFVYDARQDVWAKETFGITLRTPFSDLGVFRAAEHWSRWCRERAARPDKGILAQALGDKLPEAVTGRKGKVAYDGVWMRAYAAQAEHIAGTFERAADVLSHIGLSPAWLVGRARQLADWKAVSDREVLAAYAVSSWLLAWGVERASDVAWAENVKRG